MIRWPVMPFVLIILLLSRIEDTRAEPMTFLSIFSGALNETCKKGFSSKKAIEEKSYCLGFLYAVITRLEMAGSACFGANIAPAVRKASELLASVPYKTPAWNALEDGFKKEFPCS